MVVGGTKFITVSSNIAQAIRFLKNLGDNLDTASSMALKKTAVMGRDMARGWAPSKSGELRAGIIAVTVNKFEARIISRVKKDFPYHYWIDQQPGFELLPKKQMFDKSPDGFLYFSPNQDPFRYGAEAKTGTGRMVVWSGQPRFMTRTFFLMDDIFIGRLRDSIIGVIRKS